jgi:hypothetical protein
MLLDYMKKQQSPRDGYFDQGLFPWNEENGQSLPSIFQKRRRD